MDKVLRLAAFALFNKVFDRSSRGYGSGVGTVIGRKTVMRWRCTAVGSAAHRRPLQGGAGGFVPMQDKQYLIGFAQLPDGATLDRTEDVIRRMGEIALKHPDVENAIAFPGLSINGFTNSSPTPASSF